MASINSKVILMGPEPVFFAPETCFVRSAKNEMELVGPLHVPPDSGPLLQEDRTVICVE